MSWMVFIAALAGALLGGLAAHLIAVATKPELIAVEPDTRLIEIDERQLDHLLVLLERMSAQIDVGSAIGLRIEHAAEGVADDLAEARRRADEVAGGEPGAAADAAVQWNDTP